MSILSDVLYLVGVITFVFEGTGAAFYAALVPFARAGANFLSGLIVPLVLDRVPLQRILTGAMAGQTGLLFILAGVMLLSAGTGIWPIMILVTLIAFLEGWVRPARNSMIPRLVEADRLVQANGIMNTTDQTVQLAGWAFGGVIASLVGGRNTVWISLGLMGCATGCMLFIRDRTEKTDDLPQIENKWKSIREGWITLWKIPMLRVVTLMDVSEGIAHGVWAGAIMLVYVREVLNRGEEWWGFLNSGYFAGTILGGVLVIAFSEQVNKRLGRSVMIGSSGMAGLTIFYAFTSTPWIALVLNILMGPFMQTRDIAQLTLFQQRVELSVLPKVFSAQNSVQFATFGISVLLMAALTDWLGVRNVYLIAGVLYGVSALLAMLAMPKTSFSRFDSSHASHEL